MEAETIAADGALRSAEKAVPALLATVTKKDEKKDANKITEWPVQILAAPVANWICSGAKRGISVSDLTEAGDISFC